MGKGNIIIDGSNLLMASLAVNVDDVTNDNDYIGGVTGVLTQIAGLINYLDPYSVFVAFDKGKSKFRLDMYPEYKAGRRKHIKDEAMIYRFSHASIHASYLKELLPLLGVNVLCVNEVEADDVIANFVKQSNRYNVIVSTDKDFFQLVNDTTTIYRQGSKLDNLIHSHEMENYCRQNFKLGSLDYKHEWFISMRALDGDKSDNIPGAEQIGSKRAVQLFNEAGGNDKQQIIDHINSLEKVPKWKQNVIPFIESGKWDLNHKLMDLKHSPKLDIKKLIKPSTRDYDAAYTFLEELKVDDIMQEEDMHGILSSFDEIK